MKRPSYSAILVAALFACIGAVHSQEKNYTLSGNESGSTKAYVARDYVSLEPGFTYSASGSNTFNAKIDETLIFPPATNYMTESGTITSDPTQGGVVGSIPGQFAVSPTGAATYTIPIECPAGINGMQPNISLVYNSQGGNGIAGWGWNISGLSAINRCIPDQLRDGYSGKLTYGDYGPYTLDGKRLIFWGDPAWTFKVEDQPGINISLEPEGFIVQGKDGNRLWYGKNSGKLFAGTNNDTIICYYLDYAEDPNGNYISYTYEQEGLYKYIRKIEYGSNVDQETGFQHFVEFKYETRPDEIKYSIGKFTSVVSKRLDSIIVGSRNTTVRTIGLTYTADRYSRLQKIILTEWDGNGPRAAHVYWNSYPVDSFSEVNTSVTGLLSLYTTDYKDITYMSADLDGNGMDYIEGLCANTTANKVYVMNFMPQKDENNVTYFHLSGSVKELPGTYLLDNTKIYAKEPLVGDIDGDCKQEVVFPYFVTSSGNSFINFYAAHKNLIDTIALGGLNKFDLNDENEPVCGVADLNNDGMTEIFALERKVTAIWNTYSFHYRSTSDMVWRELEFSLIDEPQKVLAADFNSDGMTDILVLCKAGYTFCFNAGENAADNHNLSFTYRNGTDFNSQYSTVQVGDFNGDGHVDLVLNGKDNSTWQFSINKGAGTFDKISLGAITAHSNTIYPQFYKCTVLDINNDGKSDIVTSWLKGVSIRNLETYCYSTTTTFISTGYNVAIADSASYLALILNLVSGQAHEYQPFSYSKSQFAVAGDFNGDGIQEMLNYGYNLIDDNNATVGWRYYVNPNLTVSSGKVSKIVNGFDIETAYKYWNLVERESESIYTAPHIETLRYPAAFCTPTIPLVKSVETGIGNVVEKTTYNYEDARIHLAGKGFLGFRVVTEADTLQNKSVARTYSFDNQFYHPYLAEEKVCLIDTEKKIRLTTNNMEVVPLGGGLYFPKTVSTSETIYPKRTTIGNPYTLSKLTEYLSYDYFGDPLSVRTTAGDLIETQNITYGQYGSWCPNKPKLVTTTRQLGSNFQTRRIDYKYDTKGNVVRQVIDSTDVNKFVTAYKNFDSFGHPLTIEETANGNTRSSSVVYTSSGRFVQNRTNALGETTTYDWDETRGLLNTETTRLGTTSYMYDGLGRRVRTEYPDGIKKSDVLRWANSGNDYGASYYTYSETSGSGPVYIWYDTLGREIVKETKGLNDDTVRVFTEYYMDGKIKRISEPTFETSAQTWATTYTYNNYGQPETITTPLGITTYAYDGLTTTITSPSGTTEKKLYSNALTEYIKQNGKQVTYTYYASGLTKTSTPAGGTSLTMEYDLQGNRTKLIDPDGGTIESAYNGFGELLWNRQEIKTGQLITTTNNYVGTTGLLQSIVRNGEITAYTYDGQNRISTIEIAGKNKQAFAYDAFDRITQETETIGAKSFLTKTEYDALGREKKHIYPSGYSIINWYDTNGLLVEVTDNNSRSIWKELDENAKGQLLRVSRGGRETKYGFDARSFPDSIYSSGIVDMTYSFNTKGNLEYRQDNHLTNQKELFTYDELNRLTKWNVYRNNVLAKSNGQTYHDTTGNIATRTDLDNISMYYGLKGKPHALDSIDGVPAKFPTSNLSVTYTDFKKIDTLSEGNKLYTLTYGVDDQRRKSVYQVGGVVKQTRYYLGDYEEEVDASGNIRKIHYLSGGAVLILNNGKDSLLFGYTDYQGSLIALTEESGNVLQRYAYDPWGNRRNPEDWTQSDTRTSWLLNRGYTMHEHLDAFGIINMNGRVYDPLTGMFFSPDPYVQAPGDWLNYNRYGYCLNNPLVYTDPSGENPLIIAAIFAGLIEGGANLASNWHKVDNVWDGLGYFASGAAGGAISVFNPVLGGSITSTGNIITDVAGGDRPDIKNAKDAALYVGGKFLDGFGAAGSGQIGKAMGASISSWFQRVSYEGTTQLVKSEVGVMYAELPTFIVESSKNEFVAGVGKVAAGSGTQGFRSFSAFKRAMGPAGEGQAWHHIVEKTPGNIAKFGNEAIHNTTNLMKLPNGVGTIHARVSGYYSSIQPFTGGQTVRQWLSTQSFQAQYDFGLQTLRNFGW